MRVIGTAGHVDHGKSTLVKALTGTNPDRLKEEQEREMTIDLGFAWLQLPEWARLPDADEIGIIDVPGHRDFIDNMLAGVGGIDAALFVIAADEGVMPQSREHLAILDLLQIQTGVVALTKVDLIDDPDWLPLVEDETRQLLSGTSLAGAPILPVSAQTRVGLDDLVKAISAALAARPPRPDLKKPRLPVDRIFTIAGFGTVVTGTLSDGALTTGEEIEVLPPGHRGRIRGIQSHKQKSDTVVPGSRTAVNISGVDKNQIARGDVVAYPGSYHPTRRLDVEFRLLTDADSPVKHDMEVKFFIGAAEQLGRVRLLGVDALRGGESGWLQVELREPVVAARGDRYILRRPSPGATLGGGVVLDPHPAGRHRRFSKKVLERMEALSAGTPEDILRQTALEIGPASVKELLLQSGLEMDVLEPVLAEMLDSGELVSIQGVRMAVDGQTIIAARYQWVDLKDRFLIEVNGYHRRYPLRSGMSREELRSRLDLTPEIFQAATGKLVAEGVLEEAGSNLSAPDHQISFSDEQDLAIKTLEAAFQSNPYSPPSVKESIAVVGEDVYTALLELNRLTQVSPDVVFETPVYVRMVAEIRDGLAGGDTISVAQFRDRYGTSRKYALGFLEHLDQVGITIRDGDVRRLK
ncbi:MAG: selenocysteine-specific translation elongation factor [Anaerolineales bacterium]|nr:selenocysteine-specific translation elongation factor [Anaerolineales bacterium]